MDRYLAARFVFLDPKDIICASALFYQFRIFERRYGSAKFMVCFFGIMPEAFNPLTSLGRLFKLYNLLVTGITGMKGLRIKCNLILYG